MFASFTPAATSETPVLCCDELSQVKENAIRYTAGALLRKLERKYSKQKGGETASLCTVALKKCQETLCRQCTTIFGQFSRVDSTC